MYWAYSFYSRPQIHLVNLIYESGSSFYQSRMGVNHGEGADILTWLQVGCKFCLSPVSLLI